MTEPRGFDSRVVDEYGGEYPSAKVVIRDYKFANEETGRSKDGLFPYEKTQRVNNIAYQLSYHYNETTKAQGKKLRPLFFENEEGMSDVYVVDLNSDEVKAALGDGGDSTENVFNAIEADFKSKHN
ncbi:MAG: hypothetical protein Unbinned5350contig1004_48 [Prokaryotic dsDNA virus sp.]|nr:MAG: hypothetical protein Unbinned5350contig1004_48 [Prokaryotic dsDNA virus sp.]|tara:strand:+ start:2640 stop:3017 length:378 start_codon:yes stop_codon:yes gene_type:complete